MIKGESRAIAINDPDTAYLAGIKFSYRYYVLVVLMAVYTVNVVDRQILTILLEPIKREMALSDTQLGFLTGISFSIFYATLGIPIAMWADRSNRRNIVALTLAIFSGMTVLCGLAVNFMQLLLARIFVAVGEAGTTPPIHSIISDLFPAGKRAAAIAVYSLGVNLGVLIGFPLAGWISQLYGWRAAFFVVGLPGFLLVLLVRLTVKEPARGHADGLTAQGAAAAPQLADILRLMWVQRSFRHITAGISISAVGNLAIVTWFPSFLMRSYEMQPAQVGIILAIFMGVISGLGTYLSGYLADLLGRRDIRWNVWIVAIANAMIFPFCVAMYLSGTKLAVLCLLVYPVIALFAYLAPSVAMVHSLVSVRMRAQASAIFYLILTLVGGCIGPQLTGILSDHFHETYGQESLRYALMVMSVFWLWGGLHFYLAARTLKHDIEYARQIGIDPTLAL